MSEAAAIELPELVDHIAGRRQAPALSLGNFLRDPNTGAQLAEQRATAPEAIDEALAVATRVHASGVWSSVGLEERAAVLESLASELEKHTDALSRYDSITTGVVISLTRKMATITALAIRAAANQLRQGWMEESFPGPHGDVKLLRKPLGPSAIISPWNAPTPITAHKLASALAAGCPVVIKPSEWSPYSADVLLDAVSAAGLPEGLVQLVHGAASVGGKLVKSEAMRSVSFTGGLAAGRAIGAVCGEQIKPAQLELGGNNALIVLEDADLDLAADGVINGMTTLNGQWCRALGRLLVHESVQDALLVKVRERMAGVRLGSSMDDNSQMGPMVHAGHLAVLQAEIDRLQGLGGGLIRETPVPSGDGFFLPPTLVTGIDPSETQGEMFGPVAAVHSFGDDARALALANQAPYGLAGYVFSRDESRAWRLASGMETGMVKINGVSMLALSPAAPRPAWKLSGLGHEGARETIEFFCGDSVVGVASR